jgi:hypothetical protein
MGRLATSARRGVQRHFFFAFPVEIVMPRFLRHHRLRGRVLIVVSGHHRLRIRLDSRIPPDYISFSSPSETVSHIQQAILSAAFRAL